MQISPPIGGAASQSEPQPQAQDPSSSQAQDQTPGQTPDQSQGAGSVPAQTQTSRSRPVTASRRSLRAVEPVAVAVAVRGRRAGLALVAPSAEGYDEMLLADGTVRPHYAAYREWLGSRSADWMERKRAEADLIFRRTGITFSVYGDETGTERLIPFDVVPRVIAAEEWSRLELGLIQRVKAINRFLWDIYHKQDILRAGLIPDRPDPDQPAVPGRDGGCAGAPPDSTRTSSAWTWSATATASSTCWRTTSASRRACPTCCRTAR